MLLLGCFRTQYLSNLSTNCFLLPEDAEQFFLYSDEDSSVSICCFIKIVVAVVVAYSHILQPCSRDEDS